MIRRAFAALCALSCLALPATSRADPAGLAVFVHGSAGVCQTQPAAQCIDRAWRYADTDRDGRLSYAELDAVRRDLRAWASAGTSNLQPRERTSIMLGLMLVDTAHLDALMRGYDRDGDGYISRAELLQDVRLDRRPLGQVLADPAAVDRQATARRFGAMAPLVQGLFPPS